MSTNEPMTQEQLNAIKERAGEVTTLRSASFNDWQELALHLSESVDDLLAEVERLRALLTVDEDMVERAARESWCLDMQGNHALWAKLPDEKREPWRNAAYIALDAALEDREEA